MTKDEDADPDVVLPLDVLQDGATPAGLVPTLPPTAAVIGLRVVGTSAQLELSPVQGSFSLGGAARPAVDLSVDGPGVSRLHALLVRKGSKLRVLDQQSTNGTFFRGHFDPDFEIAAGDAFRVSWDVKLLAIDENLKALRARLLWMLGFHAHTEVDAALEAVARNEALLIVGPDGADHEKLADNIHKRSPYYTRGLTIATRHSEPTAIAAARGSIYLDLTYDERKDREALTPLGPELVVALFARDHRPLIAVATEPHASAALGRRARTVAAIEVPPLARRAADILKLLDALIVQRTTLLRNASAPALPLAALGRANLDALQAYAWPANFPELREAAERLHAVLANRFQLRAAARFLGQPSSTFADGLSRIGVRLKRCADDADAMEIDGASLLEADAVPTPSIGPVPT